MIEFALNPALDAPALARAFADRGRLSIDAFLSPGSAEALARHLGQRTDWVQVMNAGQRVFEIPEAGWAEIDQAARDTLETLVTDAARHGFHYRYDTIRVPDSPADRAARGALLDRFALFLSSPPVLDFFRIVTGNAAIDFADAQGTRYRPGHFLLSHDDDVAGKGRQAAYVLGLTRGWKVEWGGLLIFHDTVDGAAEAFAPAFNSLRLFAVPALHSVSYVAPYANGARTSITGWLRAAD